MYSTLVTEHPTPDRLQRIVGLEACVSKCIRLKNYEKKRGRYRKKERKSNILQEMSAKFPSARPDEYITNLFLYKYFFGITVKIPMYRRYSKHVAGWH